MAATRVHRRCAFRLGTATLCSVGLAGAASAVSPLVAGGPRPAPPQAAAATGVAAWVPVRLLIPTAGVDAPVESVGATATGNIGVPSSPAATAWYDLGPSPGQPGDAIITGHLDGTRGTAIFWNLHRLHAGDTVSVVLAGGSRVRFTVDRLRYYRYDAPPAGLDSSTGPPQLSLITCAGAWDDRLHTYLQRLVVTAGRAP